MVFLIIFVIILLISGFLGYRFRNNLVNLPIVRNFFDPNLLKKGEPCGQNIGNCQFGLVCDYPCGIPGCQNVCMEKGHAPIP